MPDRRIPPNMEYSKDDQVTASNAKENGVREPLNTYAPNIGQHPREALRNIAGFQQSPFYFFDELQA